MTKIYEDNFYIAGLQSLYYIGPAHIRELIKKFGSPYDAWEAVKNPNNLQSFTSMTTRYINCVSANANDERLQSIYDKIQEYHMSYLTYLDADFPEILRHIYNPPAIVFMRGNRALLDDRIPKIGIVGARKCSIYGRNVARMLGKELSKYVTVIVSGGARGIDCHSHEGTLSAHGYGIIVMGCGLDIAYPPRDNAKLFDRMLQEGGPAPVRISTGNASFSQAFSGP
nr:DNA-processing protein DprA [Veillonella denticariosi]